MNPLVRASIAEALGVFVLVFVGAGAVCANAYLASPQGTGGLGVLGVSAAGGLGLMAAVYLTAGLSGAHLNPAITLGLWLAGRCSAKQAWFYWIFQFLGAIAAGVAVWAFFPGVRATPPYLGTPAYVSDPSLPGAIGPVKAIGVEAVLTFLLAIVVMMTAFHPRRAAKQMFGLCIGATAAVAGILGAQHTGGAVNPARYFGPAVVSGEVSQLLVYFVGPLLGGAIAGLVFRLLFDEKEAREESAA
jgi:MIP family channel proteins